MSSNQWKKDNTVSFLLRYTNSSGVPGALRKVEESTPETAKGYIRRAVIEALQRDGYLPKKKVKLP